MTSATRWPGYALAVLATIGWAEAPDTWARLDRETREHYRDGDYAGALASGQLALNLAEREVASKSGAARLATSLNAVALIHQAEGRYAEAGALLERALQIAQRTLPADHADIAALRTNLESLQQARERHEQALEARRAQDINDAALTHHDRGEYDEAASLYEQSLSLVEKHFGPDSVELARVLANLADTHEQRKDYARAETLYRRALTIYEAHPDEAVAQANILNAVGCVHYMRKQYDQAAPLFKQALQTMEAARGMDHVDLLPMLDNLNSLYLTTRRNDRAEEFRQRAVAIRRAHGLSDR